MAGQCCSSTAEPHWMEHPPHRIAIWKPALRLQVRPLRVIRRTPAASFGASLIATSGRQLSYKSEHGRRMGRTPSRKSNR